MGREYDAEWIPLIAETRRLALFALAAVLMVAGILAILVGILCKIGRLHSYFIHHSYTMLDGEDTRSVTACKVRRGNFESGAIS